MLKLCRKIRIEKKMATARWFLWAGGTMQACVCKLYIPLCLETGQLRSMWHSHRGTVCTTWVGKVDLLTLMKIAPLGLAGGRSYDRTNSLRTPTMKESQLLRERTTSSVFLSTCSNAVHAQFHWLAYTRNTRPCDVFCLQWKHFRSIAGMIAPPAKIYARDRSRSRWNMKHFRQTANRTRLLAAPVLPGSRSTGMH